MKYKRKVARKNSQKKYKRCGYEMSYKESYGVYVCGECGRIRSPVTQKGGAELEWEHD